MKTSIFRLLILAAFCTLLACKDNSDNPKEYVGVWVVANDPQLHPHWGFVLHADGKASSINENELTQYLTWRIEDTCLLLSGDSIIDGVSSSFTDVIDVLSLSKDSMSVIYNGEKINYSKDMNIKKLIKDSDRKCYIALSQKKNSLIDSAFLNIQIKENTAIGHLEYTWESEDSQDIEIEIGDFIGTMRGDTLLASYKYWDESEGIESIRQVCFLRKNNGQHFIQGHGEMIDNNTKFKDIKKVKFDGLEFKTSPCTEKNKVK